MLLSQIFLISWQALLLKEFNSVRNLKYYWMTWITLPMYIAIVQNLVLNYSILPKIDFDLISQVKLITYCFHCLESFSAFERIKMYSCSRFFHRYVLSRESFINISGLKIYLDKLVVSYVFIYSLSPIPFSAFPSPYKWFLRVKQIL